MRLMIKGAVRLPWLLDKAVYTGKSFSVATQETVPTGLFIKSDGLKLYICGLDQDKVNQYSLSTAWDISAASHATSFTLTHAVNPTARGLFFKSDGTKMYVADSGATLNTNQYSLSTAWDTSTASYDSVSIDETGRGNSTDVVFSSDGTNLYYPSSNSSGIIYQLSLSSAWDLSTATYGGTFLSTSGQATNPLGAAFNDTGTLLFVANNDGVIYQYVLSTAWDVSSASYRGSSLNPGQDGVSQGITLKTDGTLMYILGSATDKIYQYSL